MEKINRIYEPKFTYYGFIYVLVQGKEKVDPKDFEGVVIHSNLEKTIECKTDNDKINQLIKCAYQGQKGNFLDVPNDCPQRDELFGWNGDTQVFPNRDIPDFYQSLKKQAKNCGQYRLILKL